MIKAGLTGGIGGGKSTVAKIFEALGIPVYYADDAAKNLMNTNEALKTAIIHHFGTESYINGVLNRPHLASIVFNDKEKIQLLNSITHPVVIQDAEVWMSRQRAPYAIKEAALLFESGAAAKLDYIIGVFAHTPIRVRRIMSRDNVTEEEAIKRINSQMDDEEKMKQCHYVITNTERKLTVSQVVEVDRKLRELSQNQ